MKFASIHSPYPAIYFQMFRATVMPTDRRSVKRIQTTTMAVAYKSISIEEMREFKRINCWYRTCGLYSFTNKGTNGATNAPIRATVEAAPTPMLRITVGIISAVCTYDVAKADVIPSFPSKNSETTAHVQSDCKVGMNGMRNCTAAQLTWGIYLEERNHRPHT